MSTAGMPAELFAEMKSCKYPFVPELNRPNSLRLVVEEGKASRESMPLKTGTLVISAGSIVLSGRHTSLCEIVWDHSFACSVLNQMDSLVHESEKFERRNPVRVYTASKFLDHVRHAIFAHEKNPGLSQPIQIICQWHVMDVISTTVPTVKKLRSPLRD